jgi:hypothetical protein
MANGSFGRNAAVPHQSRQWSKALYPCMAPHLLDTEVGQETWAIAIAVDQVARYRVGLQGPHGQADTAALGREELPLGSLRCREGQAE